MKDFDKDLKDKAKIDSVPKSVNKKIDETLKGLENREKVLKKPKKGIVRKGIIAAGLFLSIGVGGTTATAVINDISFKEALKEVFNYDEIDEYILEVGETVSKKGIDFKITSSISDGYRIIIGYEVTSDKFKPEELKEKIYTDVKFEGKPLMGDIGSYRQEIKDNKVVGIYEINIADIYMDGKTKTIGEFHGKEIEVVFNCQGMERTKWNLKVKIDASKMQEEIKEYPLNIKTEWGEVNNIVITPLNIYLRGVRTKKIDYIPSYMIRNEKGELAEFTSSGIGAGPELMEKGERRSFSVTFKNNFKSIESLEILEKKSREGMTKIEIKDGKAKEVEKGELEILELENKESFKVKYKENDKIDINGVENSEGYWGIDTKNNISIFTLEEGVLKDGQYKLTYNIEETPKKLEEIAVKK